MYEWKNCTITGPTRFFHVVATRVNTVGTDKRFTADTDIPLTERIY